MKQCVFFVFLFSLLCLELCRGIILSNQEVPKPAYTSGIKTANWKQASTIHTHQNYSKVYVHNNPNNPSQYAVTTGEKSERVYPIYNAHSYGRQEQTQNIIGNSQTSHNLTHEGRFANVVGGALAGSHKNRTIYKRKIEYKTIEVYEKCPEGATGPFVYYLSCNQYLNCWKGRGDVQNCAPGTLFNPKTLECDFPDKVQCVTGRQNSVSLQSSRSQKSITQATCPKEFSGLIPNYTDCSKFINCNNGHQVSMDCPPGTLFDTTQNVCNFPYLTTCFNGANSHSSVFDQSHSGQSQGQHQGQSQGQHVDYQGHYIHKTNHQGQHNGHQYHYQGHGTNQHGSQGQAGGQYHQTSYSQSSQGQNCNPQTQNCGYSTDQGHLTYGTLHPLGVNHYGQSTVKQYHQYGSTGQQSNVQQGVDSRLDFGQDGSSQQATYNQVPINRVTPCNPLTQNCNSNVGVVSQTNHGLHYGQNCDPQTQNCVQGSRTAQHEAHSYSSVPNCDPRTQNCGQSYGNSHGHSYGHSAVPPCDPRVQNCGQSYGNSHGHSYGHSAVPPCDPRVQNCGQSYDNSHGHSYGHSAVPPCDPRVQNCGQSYGNSHGQSYGHSAVPPCDPRVQNCGQGSSDNQGHRQGQVFATGCDPRVQNCGQSSGGVVQQAYGQSTVQRCNPQAQNCGTSHGYGTTQSYNYNYGQSYSSTQSTTTSRGHSRTSGSGQHNYQTVCNIGDLTCQKPATTKKAKEPKCPEGFQGITKHPTNCKKFLNCANGITFIQDCAPGTLFNPNIGNCDFPYNVDCSNNETNETTTENYDATTKNDWDNTHQEHAQRYGQNAGHGNIRATTTPHYQSSYDLRQGSYGQGHTQGSYPNNRDDHTSQGSVQGHNSYNQGQSNQGTGGVKTGHNIHKTTNRGGISGSGGGVTIIEPVTPVTNGDPVINRGQIGLVTRPTYTRADPAAKRNNARDYGDVFDPDEAKSFTVFSTTARSAGKWPPPFPTTDVNADYVFEYEDGEPVTLEPENVFRSDNKKQKKADCGKRDFYCSAEMCVSKTAVCDGHRDCQNGKDELDCQEYLKRFAISKNSQLNVLEDQRWINVSEATCALLCIHSTSFECRSFNYRKIDRTCFLSNLNIGLTGALRQYYPHDYYELKTATIDCTMLFKCNNNKCITNHQLCDGFGDCETREDEKKCSPEDFGYTIKLAGTGSDNEGRVEVTAFGKTGYICDDHFGIKDANVVCRELGFQLGAAEIKGHSHYATDLKEKNTLYMVDDLDCSGNETTLLDCNFPGWGVHNCRDQEIAGLVCKTPQEKCGKESWKCDSGNECVPYSFVCDGLFDCTDDSDEAAHHCEASTELRLVNGTSNRQGRVEIKHHGIWGTICDDDFNEDAAKVVCKYFGFKGTAIVKKEAYFGQGEGPIWLDQVSCYGNETELHKCTHWNWGAHNCDHNEDVGVICRDEEEVQLQRHSKISDEHSTSKVLPVWSCGFRKDNQFLENDLIHARVVGGSVARKGDYPWQAALRIKGKAQQSHHWCGAVILSSQWVITAAHCLQGYAKGAYMIIAGEYNTDEEEGTEQTKYIEEYFVHDNFTEGERVMKNDIALVKVKGTGFSLNEDVQPVCLPDFDTDYERELNCTISGFGSVKTGNSAYSHNLMAAWIPLIRSDICRMPHIYDTAMSEGMICAGFLNGGIDSCHGDSGGPLACLDHGLFTLYGITSWGHRCGFANKPGVYVKVAHYRKWIDDTIKNN